MAHPSALTYPHHSMTTDTLERPPHATAQQKRPKNRGNFANDPARAREAGRKGGKARGKPRVSRPM